MGVAKKYTWYICPSCRSRLAVERHDPGEIRCRNCSTLIRPAVADTASASTISTVSKRAAPEEDEEYRLAPALDESRVKSGQSPKSEPPPVYHSELDRLRGRRERLELPTRQADAQSAAIEPMPEATEIRDDQRYAPAPPPRWPFFSGVFTYPWRPQSIMPWIVLSLGVALCGATGLLIIGGLTSGSSMGAVVAGFLGLGWIWLLLLSGSYAAACIFAVTETTAYNYDAPYDWPEPDWRERVFHFLWLGWCLGLAAALAVLPATTLFENLQDRSLVFAAGIAVLFPIFVLSTLETNSLSPVSSPVWGSLLAQSASWIAFYVLSSVVMGACGVATVILVRRMGVVAAFPAGPLWGAGILIYARLLGRLAWRIMQPGEKQLQAWRRANQSSLAGDARRRPPVVDEPFEAETRV